MTSQPPISPSFELRNQWHSERPFKNPIPSREREDYMVDRAAQWGADQELEACCEWFQEEYKTESWVTHDLKRLRTARRPKSPSLKEQALAALNVIEDKMFGPTTEEILIRSALEALPND
jgi:hypothetical protein